MGCGVKINVIRQLEIDVGLTATWDMAGDRDVWMAQRPIAGQAVQ